MKGFCPQKFKYLGLLPRCLKLSASVLSREVIEAAIHDFRARGEQRWFSTEPAEVNYTSAFHCKPLATDV